MGLGVGFRVGGFSIWGAGFRGISWQRFSQQSGRWTPEEVDYGAEGIVTPSPADSPAFQVPG